LNLNKQVLSVIIAIGLAIFIGILASTNIIRFSDVSSAIAYGLVVAIIGVLVWGFKSKIYDKFKIEHKENFHEDKQKLITSTEEKKPKTICRKTIKIHVDEHDDLKLNLKRGQIIRGEISSDGFFNIYFLTPSSFRSFKKEYGFQYLGDEEVLHYESNFEVPSKGIYHIVFQNADKKNIVVSVNLYSE